MSEHPNLSAALVAQPPVEILADIGAVAVHRQMFNPIADRGASRIVQFHNRYCEMLTTGCWVWVSSINTTGYGMFAQRTAHRFGFELHFGSIPDGLVLDHLCRNKACVNPDHLEPVTQKENVRRHNEAEGIKQYATECRAGHSLVEFGRMSSAGYRRCAECDRLNSKARYQGRRLGS